MSTPSPSTGVRGAPPADEMKLSIIIPVFNEERTIAHAIESVLFQDVSFAFEVIVIDDRSTDRTPQIVEELARRFSQLTLLRNSRNLGKGSSVMRGYAAARGKYFQVLDGDDFFVSWNKLQQQVEFLEGNPGYFAVGHNTAILHTNREISFIRKEVQAKDFEYADCISNGFYCHTSSYVFRKFGDQLPEYFRNNSMRGDTALFFYHAIKAKSKVRYSPSISSVYNFHGSGLWSRLNDVQRSKLNVEVLEAIDKFVVNDKSSMEHAVLQKHLKYARRELGQPKQPNPPTTYSIDDVLTSCEKIAARIFDAKVSGTAFKGMYSLPVVDQLSELVGRILMFKKNYTISDRVFDESKIVILVSGFVPHGGGIFREIKELISIHVAAGFSVDIYSSGKIPTDPAVIMEHFDHPRITYWQANCGQTPSALLDELITKLHAAAPARIYPFITHHDVVLSAALQRGLGKKIVLDYVYDHGLSLAIHNSSIDKIFIKTQSQADALSPVIDPTKFLLIPPFVDDIFRANPFRPYRNGSLTTASAAARSYKVENEYTYSYFLIVVEILKLTGGTHYHYGPLQPQSLDFVHAEMANAGINPRHFVHVPWADKFGQSLLVNGVDLFIAPFPVCSARIAVEVMSCGIPIANHNLKNPGLPQAIDFVDPNQWTWDVPDDLFQIIRSMDPQALLEKSRSARQFFLSNNDIKVASKHIIECAGQPLLVSAPKNFQLRDLVEEGLIKLDLPFLQGGSPADTVSRTSQIERPVTFWRRTRPWRRKISSIFQGLAGRSEP